MNPERVSYQPPFGLRLTPELKAQIAALARANRRSLNTEITVAIEHHLERALAQPASAGNDPSKSLPADAKVTS